MSDGLNKIFDVEPPKKDESLADAAVTALIEDSKPSEDADFDFARKNYYKILEQANVAMLAAMKMVKESEHPRAVEVLSGLLKNVADVNRQLIQLTKDQAEAKQAKKATGPTGPLLPAALEDGSVALPSNDINKLLAEKAQAAKNSDSSNTNS